MRLHRIWILLFFVYMTLSGCASIAPVTVPTMSDEESSQVLSMKAPSDKAAVFIYRNSSFYGQAAHYSVAVNGTVVGWNASGTCLRLVLPPGDHQLHTFNFYRGTRNPKATDHTLKIRVEAGKSYFVSHYSQMRANTAGPVFEVVSEQEGKSKIEGLKLARFDTRFLPISAFPTQPINGGNAASAATTSVNVDPTDDSLSKIFEGLAIVLLVGLSLYAAAHSGPPIVPDFDLYKAPDRRPTVVIPVPQTRKAPDADVTKSYLTTGGDIYQVSDNRIYSPTRAEEWRINGNQIQGSNGQTFRVSGDTVYTENGHSYRVSGNNVFGSDGTICTINGNLTDCR